MNKQVRILFFWTGALLFSTLACSALTSLNFSNRPTPSPVLMQTIQGASCPSTLNDIMRASTTPGEYEKADQETYLAIYKVTGEEITDPVFETVPTELKSKQDDLATQKQAWEYFAALIPEQHRDMISNYLVLTDGKDNVLAAVAQTRDDPTRWVLEVDIADTSDYANLTFTMMHEFGHLLTLNANQVTPSIDVFNNPGNTEIYNQAASSCSSYFLGEGCSKNDSYINQFYQRFWSDIYPEWSQVNQIENEALYYEKLNAFYEQHQDRFVSEYASTNPGEDIAETWAYFVLAPKPQGNTIADQKVLFFYEHPELVQLRTEILSRLCTIFPE